MDSRVPISALVRCSPRAAKTSASRAEMPTSGDLLGLSTFQIVPQYRNAKADRWCGEWRPSHLCQ